ncbi:MAG: hypothetical protein H0T42_06355 [Deltaproteobacteria bacterium]|nr:hypothetical protein [Deltaproteobacteria bacterium]
MRTSLMLSLVLLSVACKDKDVATGDKPASSKKGHTPAGTPRPQDKLTVTLDGKPVAMATALAWKTWDGQVRVTVSSVPVSCDEVTGDMRRIHDGEVSFDIQLAHALQPDGTRKPMLAQTYYSGSTTGMLRVVVPSTGDGTPGQPTTAEVEFEQAAAGESKQVIKVKGTIDALGCAVPPRKDVPPLPPPMAGTIEIAGVKLPVRFAKLDTSRDWPKLELYTGAEACKDVAFAPRSELEVALTWFDKAKPEVGQVTIDGSILGNLADQTFDEKKLTVTPFPLAPGEIEITGDIVVSNYPVKLAGKVTAVVCPKE